MPIRSDPVFRIGYPTIFLNKIAIRIRSGIRPLSDPKSPDRIGSDNRIPADPIYFFSHISNFSLNFWYAALSLRLWLNTSS